MSLFDDIRLQGASARISEEVLYAEALREVEQGRRRDGLWAKALAQSRMDPAKAHALYLELRVQSLRDEIALVSRHLQLEAAKAAASAELPARQPRSEELRRQRDVDPERERPPSTVRDWLNVVLGAIFVVAVGASFVAAYQWLVGR